jgi:hypothetical protein
VFLVTLKVRRRYRVQDNITLMHCAAHFRNAYLIDWYHFSRDHPRWFYPGGGDLHLRPAGRTAYATFVSHQVSLHA